MEISETLTPVEMTIDEKSKIVVMLIKIKKTEKSTGNIFESDAMAWYELALDEQKEIKLKSLKIFTDDFISFRIIFFFCQICVN